MRVNAWNSGTGERNLESTNDLLKVLRARERESIIDVKLKKKKKNVNKRVIIERKSVTEKEENEKWNYRRNNA